MTDRAIKAYVRRCVDRKVCDEIAQLRKDLKLPPPSRRLLNLREAVEYKGGSFNTVKNRLKRQPKGGKADVLYFGSKYWWSRSVMQWADITDNNLNDYLSACESGQVDRVRFS